MIEAKEMGIDAMLEVRNNLKHTLFLLETELLKSLTLWQSKALNGFVLEATKQYREENGTSLKDAHDVIKMFVSLNKDI